MITGWEQLEEAAADLINDDNPRRPPNSGGAKKEEDVVGSNIIIQCKYTDNKNMSILKKDLDRLLDSANLLSKFPIFLTSNGSNDTVISIPMNHDVELIKDLMRVIIVHKGLEYLTDTARVINNPNQLEKFRKQETKFHYMIKGLVDKFQERFKKLADILETKYKNLMMYNLFEGNNNAAK